VIRRAALLALAALVLGGCEGSRQAALPSQLYRDPDGWAVSYPRGFHVERSEGNQRVFIKEVTIGNFRPRRGVRTDAGIRVLDPVAGNGRFPRDGVAFRIERWEGGNLTLPDPTPEARFPLRVSQFQPQIGDPGKPRGSPRVRALEFEANGLRFIASVWIGRDVAAAGRHGLEALVESLRFRPLRPGSVVGQGFAVLERASHYPKGSFTRGRTDDLLFYLVHAPGGFYAVGWPSAAPPGGPEPTCDVRFVPRRLEFRCSGESRTRWDRLGRLVAPASNKQSGSLRLMVAKLGHDGHMLVGVHGWTSTSDEHARRFWPKWHGGTPARTS